MIFFFFHFIFFEYIDKRLKNFNVSQLSQTARMLIKIVSQWENMGHDVKAKELVEKISSKRFINFLYVHKPLKIII